MAVRKRKPASRKVKSAPLKSVIHDPDQDDIESINLDGIDKDSLESIELFENFLRDIIQDKSLLPGKKIILGFQAAKVLIELKKKKAEGIERLEGAEDLSHLTDVEICRLLNREPADRHGNAQTLMSFRDFESEDQSNKAKDFKLPEETGKDDKIMEAFNSDDIENDQTEDIHSGEKGILQT